MCTCLCSTGLGLSSLNRLWLYCCLNGGSGGCAGGQLCASRDTGEDWDIIVAVVDEVDEVEDEALRTSSHKLVSHLLLLRK